MMSRLPIFPIVLLTLAVASSACSSDSSPPVRSSVTLRIAVPAGVTPTNLSRLEVLVGGGATAPAVVVLASNSRVRTVTPAGGGAPVVEIVLQPTPFLSPTAEIVLLPASTARPETIPALTVTAIARRGDGTAVGQATVDNAGGAPIRFTTGGDLAVDVPLACALAEGCVADGGTPGDGGTDGGMPDAGPAVVDVTGTVTDRVGTPLVDAEILLGTGVLRTDTSGGFAQMGVTLPYDLTVAPPASRKSAAVSWLGVDLAAPKVGTPRSAAATRTMKLRVGHFVGVGNMVEIRVAGRSLAEFTGFPLLQIREKIASIADPANETTDIGLSWQGPESVEILIAGLRYALPNADAGTTTRTFQTFGITKIQVSDGVDASFFLPTTTLVAARTVAVDVTGAESFVERRYSPMLEFNGDQISLPGTPVGGYTTPSVPLLDATELAAACPTCTQFVRVAARETPCTGGGTSLAAYTVSHSAPVGATATNVAVTLHVPPTVTEPAAANLDGGIADGGTEPAAPMSYQFAAAAAHTARMAIVFIPNSANGHAVWTGGSAGTFPDLRTLDAGLPSGLYQFAVLATDDPRVTVRSLLETGTGGAPVLNDSCSSSNVYQGLPPGRSVGLSGRLVELKP